MAREVEPVEPLDQLGELEEPALDSPLPGEVPGPLEPLHTLRVRDRLRPVRGDEPTQQPVHLRKGEQETDLDQRVKSEDQAAGSTQRQDFTHG